MNKLKTQFLNNIGKISITYLVLSSFLLFFCSYNLKPTSYLHSWNQVTTLVHTEYISKDLSYWNKPLDVITRISAHPAPKTLSLEEPYSDFRIFEEFPLYHTISALIAKSGLNPLNSSRLFSVISFFISGFFVFLITNFLAGRIPAWFSVLIWSNSFPVLYYGQAMMSDMSMTASAIGSIYFFCLYFQNRNSKYKISGLALVTLSSLFKSFGVIYIIPWLFLFIKNKSFKNFLISVLFTLPVISWHIWCFLQDGNQEVYSHSINGKISIILSSEFLLAIQKYYFRYVSYAAGVILVLYVLLKLINKIKVPQLIKSQELKHILLYSFYFSIIAFLITTADKLPDHDYYMLLASPVLIIICGICLFQLLNNYLNNSKRILIIGTLICLTAIPISLKSLNKALTENDDVTECTELIQKNTDSSSIHGFFTDVSRYNSLAFFSNRFGLAIEETHFPISRYLEYGLDYLVINLPEDYFNHVEDWLNTQTDVSIKQLALDDSLKDFKDRPRVCAVYKIK